MRGKEVQLVLPKKYREEAMREAHDEKLAGHLGVFKTVERVARKYWWPEMLEDITNWVKGCTVCQEFKKGKEEKVGFLQPIEANLPFELMGMDILEDLKETPSGNKHILVLTDYYTKWPEAFPMKDKSAATIAKILVTQVICRHGVPERIITDRGSDFMSDLFRQVAELLKMKHSPTTPYHPQTDGQTERMIGTLKGILERLAETENNWDEQIPYALYAY